MRRGNGGFRGRNNQAGAVVARNNNNNNNIQEIQGFSSLAQQGNALLERDPVNPFLFRRLFIDPNTGALLGATRGETIRQLREFYLKNFDKFQGNARRLVQQFLLANGAAAALNGQLRVDLSSGTAPNYKGVNPADTRLAQLNYLLNLLSDTCQPLRVQQQNVGADGTANLNLRGAFRSSALALLANDNPYSCGRNVPPRVDFLINRMMDPKTYYAAVGQPNTLKETADQLGVQDDKKRTSGNKIVIAAPPGGKTESIVATPPERTLEVQQQGRRPGLGFWISWDVTAQSSPGVETESRSPFVAGINYTHDASEAIWHKCNGFLQFGLFNAAGQIQTAAPSSVASARGYGGTLGDEVDAPFMCLRCHSNGFLGGGISKATQKPYTDNTLGIDPDGKQFGSRIPSFHRQFFTSNANYNQSAVAGSRIFVDALKRTGSCVPAAKNEFGECAGLIPDSMEAYRANLSMDQAAKELGTSKEALAAVVGGNRSFTRQDFERFYCTLLQRVGTGSVLNGGVPTGVGGVNSFSRPVHNTSPGFAPRRR